MSCQECVGNAARGLAAIAENLSPQLARQLFTAMFPEPSCLPMGQTFLQILRASRAEARQAPAAEYLPPSTHAEPLYRVAAA